jgi:uncharacterized protein YndB with AHSA1/START domain
MSEHGRLVDVATIEFRRRLPADIDTVWSFFTDPAKRAKWFCGGATADHPGGAIVFDFDHRKLSKRPPPEKYADSQTACFEGTVLEYDSPHRLVFDWPGEGDSDRSRVEITLTAIDPATTEMVLRHAGLEKPDYLIGGLAGWHAHLDMLADLLAGRNPIDFWPRHIALEDDYSETLGR